MLAGANTKVSIAIDTFVLGLVPIYGKPRENDYRVKLGGHANREVCAVEILTEFLGNDVR